jgi:hypothetical protein
MSTKIAVSTVSQGSREKSPLTPHRIVLVVMWVVTTTALVAMLVNDVRATGEYKTIRYILQAGYVAVLFWYLVRTGPSVKQLPEINPQVLPRRRYGAWISVLVIALLLVLTLVSEQGASILMLLMMVATGPILLVWRREIRWRSVLQGLAVAVIAFLAGRQMADNGYLSNGSFYLLPG